MGDQVLRWVLKLHPKAWRERYGNEILDLADELVAEHESTWVRLALGLLASVLIERFRSLVQRHRVLVASSLAAIAIVGITALSTNLFGFGVSNPQSETVAARHAPGTITGSLNLYTLVDLVEPGSVSFVGDNGNHKTVHVGIDGRFTLNLPPGRYSASGKSPQVYSDGAEMKCASRSPVVVHGGVTTEVTVVCEGY
jgi:hypothetical protein